MRKNYIDNIKWITQIVVVLYHVIMIYNSLGFIGGIGKITNLKVQYYDILLYIPYPWAMALLFIVSGMSTRYYLQKHTDKELLISRTVKFLIPSTVGVCLFWLIQGYINMHIIGNWGDVQGGSKLFIYFIMVLNGVGVLWFVQVLWLDSVIIVLLRKIEKGRLLELGKRMNTIGLILSTFAIIVASQVLNGKVFVVYRMGLYILYFLLGYYVFSHDEVMERVKKMMPLYVLLAIILCITFCVKYWGENCAYPPINQTVLFACFSWFGCLAVLSFMATVGDFSNKITAWLTNASYGVYLCHWLVISSIGLYLVKPGIISGWLAYLVTIIGGFVGGYLLYQVILKIPVVRTLLVGSVTHR